MGGVEGEAEEGYAGGAAAEAAAALVLAGPAADATPARARTRRLYRGGLRPVVVPSAAAARV
jgi:hypothetical protein